MIHERHKLIRKPRHRTSDANTSNVGAAANAAHPTTLADIIDAKRSLRLELIVIFLIAFEIVVTGYEIFSRGGH